MSNGDQFCIEPAAPSGGGAPSAHADSHKAGGSDPLLASPGAIGGGTANTIRGTTITATTGFVGDGSQLTNLPGGGAFTFSPVDLYTVGADYLGDYTTGGRFVAIASVSITGVRFTRFVNAATMTVKLWKGGASLATASQAVTTGVYSVTFGSPVVLAAGDEFFVTTYDGGTRYAKNNTPPSFDPSWSTGLIIPFGAKVALLAPSYYAAGDAQPNTSGGERFPVEPIY